VYLSLKLTGCLRVLAIALEHHPGHLGHLLSSLRLGLCVSPKLNSKEGSDDDVEGQRKIEDQ
jgi:hypothetical protein